MKSQSRSLRTKNKRAKTMVIVHSQGVDNAINRWLIEELSSSYDFTSAITDDNRYIDGLELIDIPPVITLECAPF